MLKHCQQGLKIVLSGPSGTGKSVLTQKVLAHFPSARLSVSYTTRTIRASEQNHREYHFITPAEFEARIARNEFAEWAEVYGNYYGTHQKETDDFIGQGVTILFEIEHVGKNNLAKVYSDLITIYILPPSILELERRLLSRGTDSIEQIQRRMTDNLRDIKQCLTYDYIVVNADLTQATNQVFSILEAENIRRRRFLNFTEDV